MSLPPGSAQRGTDGLSYVSYHRASEQNGWTYAVITREQQYWFALHNTMFMLTGLIITALLASVSAALWLLRRNYRPVQRITEILQAHGMAKNEFDLIQSSCSQLIDDNRSMRSTLSSQTAHLREWYLLCAFKRRRLPLSEQDGNVHYQIENRYFGLICFALSAPPDVEERLFSVDTDCRVADAMDWVLPELEHELIEDGPILLCLLHLEEDQCAVWEEEGLERIRCVCFHLAKEGLSISAVISHTAPFAQLSQLYRDAMNTMAYQDILGTADVLLTWVCKARMESLEPMRDDGWMQELIASVMSADAKQCRARVDRLFHEYTQRDDLSFPVFRIAVHSFLYLLLSAYYEAVEDNGLRQALASRMAELACRTQAEALAEGLCGLLDYAARPCGNRLRVCSTPWWSKHKTMFRRIIRTAIST